MNPKKAPEEPNLIEQRIRDWAWGDDDAGERDDAQHLEARLIVLRAIKRRGVYWPGED